ncbi:hypothetical protein TSUD_369730 [Trifolium subterraneum]|uniref:Retrotransposon gag domain-containing protein n=1 Tax=Trifolium subterraneum TaxID=3900 RepID=A0A2Z6MKN7_TRISU|nr:hypothetical protein TSUD_369730 [Trifolium subterraneum]
MMVGPTLADNGSLNAIQTTMDEFMKQNQELQARVTAISLFSIHQGNSKSLPEFLAQLSEATIKVSNPNQEMSLAAFQNGLKKSNAEKRSRDAKEKGHDTKETRTPDRHQQRWRKRNPDLTSQRTPNAMIEGDAHAIHTRLLAQGECMCCNIYCKLEKTKRAREQVLISCKCYQASLKSGQGRERRSSSPGSIPDRVNLT